MIYEVQMSKGDKIKIDEEDLLHIQANISAHLIRVKQGIINPSFMVMIVPTNEPDTLKKPTMERGDNTMTITGEKEVKVLADLMGSEVKKLT